MGRILRTRKKQDELISRGTYTAAFLSDDIHQLLLKAAYAQGIPKGVIVRNVMTRWFGEFVKFNHSYEDGIADNIMFSWKAECHNKKDPEKGYNTRLRQFVIRAENEMGKVGFSQENVKIIITKFDAKRKERNKQTGKSPRE